MLAKPLAAMLSLAGAALVVFSLLLPWASVGAEDLYVWNLADAIASGTHRPPDVPFVIWLFWRFGWIIPPAVAGFGVLAWCVGGWTRFLAAVVYILVGVLLAGTVIVWWASSSDSLDRGTETAVAAVVTVIGLALIALGVLSIWHKAWLGAFVGGLGALVGLFLSGAAVLDNLSSSARFEFWAWLMPIGFACMLAGAVLALVWARQWRSWNGAVRGTAGYEPVPGTAAAGHAWHPHGSVPPPLGSGPVSQAHASGPTGPDAQRDQPGL